MVHTFDENVDIRTRDSERDDDFERFKRSAAFVKNDLSERYSGAIRDRA